MFELGSSSGLGLNPLLLNSVRNGGITLHRAKLTNYSYTGYLFSSELINQMPYKACPDMTHLFEVFMLERGENLNTIEIAIPVDYSFPDAAFEQCAINIYREHQEHAHLGNKAAPEIYDDGPTTLEEYTRWHNDYLAKMQRALAGFEKSDAKKTGWQLAEPV